MLNALHLNHRRTERKPDSVPTRIEQYLIQNGPCTPTDIMFGTGLGRGHVTSALYALQRMTPPVVHAFADSWNGERLYRAGPPPTIKKVSREDLVPGRTFVSTGDYTPPKWTAPRPGTTQQELGIPSRTFYQREAA